MENIILHKCAYRGSVALELIKFPCAKQDMSLFRLWSARRTYWLVAQSTIRSGEAHDRKKESATEVAGHLRVE